MDIEYDINKNLISIVQNFRKNKRSKVGILKRTLEAKKGNYLIVSYSVDSSIERQVASFNTGSSLHMEGSTTSVSDSRSKKVPEEGTNTTSKTQETNFQNNVPPINQVSVNEEDQDVLDVLNQITNILDKMSSDKERIENIEAAVDELE